MFPLAVILLFIGYAFLYSGGSQILTNGNGTPLLDALGIQDLITQYTSNTIASPDGGNGSSNQGGQPASKPTTGTVNV